MTDPFPIQPYQCAKPTNLAKSLYFLNQMICVFFILQDLDCPVQHSLFYVGWRLMRKRRKDLIDEIMNHNGVFWPALPLPGLVTIVSPVCLKLKVLFL